MLANRVYLGEAVHKGVAYPGEHAAIIDQRTWDKAHAVMAEPAHRRGAATRAQVPALLKGLIFGPNGRPMSPSHTRRRGRIYRYYVTREAIADGYDSCPVTSVPAADVEGAVLDHVQKLLAAPELVARTWAAAKREGEDEITEREVTVLLADFATVWNELFPAEQARIVQLLVERVDVQEDALEVRIRAEGLASLVGELRQHEREESGMMQGVETRLDGSTLVVRIPMRFQRRGGRKRIVAPDGSEIAPTSKPQPDGTLVKALARAWRWQRMLDEGVYASVSEIGDAENISKSYVSRILRLALLAPDIVEAILAGRTDQALMLEQLERPLPASWEEQRARHREALEALMSALVDTVIYVEEPVGCARNHFRKLRRASVAARRARGTRPNAWTRGSGIPAGWARERAQRAARLPGR